MEVKKWEKNLFGYHLKAELKNNLNKAFKKKIGLFDLKLLHLLKYKVNSQENRKFPIFFFKKHKIKYILKEEKKLIF